MIAGWTVDCRCTGYDLSSMKSALCHPVRKRLAVAALVVMGLGGCGESEPLCENIVVREAISPDGAMKAVLFSRDCGPPTGSSSQVSIVAAAETVEDKGNTFIADTAGGIARAGAWGGPDVQLAWTGPRDLTLTSVSRSRIIAYETSVRTGD